MEVTTKIKTKTYFAGNFLFPFIFPSKDIRLRFWTVSGEVTSSDKQNADGELYHEFWVRTADGKEEEFKLTNIDIPLHKGQQVTVILATPEGSNTNHVVAIANHSAGKYWVFDKYLYVELAGGHMDENALREMMQGGPLSLAIRSFFTSLFGPLMVIVGLAKSPGSFLVMVIVGVFVQAFALHHPGYVVTYLVSLLGWNSIQLYKVDITNRRSYGKMNEIVNDIAAKALRDGPQKMFSDEKNA